MCRHACPVFLTTKLDSITPRGHALLASRIDEGLSKLTEEIADKTYQCSLCGLCRELCEFHWEEDTLVRKAREIIVNDGAVPEIVKKIASSLIKNNNTSDILIDGLGIKKTQTRAKQVDILYISGNLVRYEQPEIIENTARILNSIQENWKMLESDNSTGIELFELGYTNDAKIIAKNLWNKIMEINPKIIITGCAHSYRALKEIHPDWGIKFSKSIKVYHIVEYLYRKLNEGKMRLIKNEKITNIAYHDPCQLGRNMGVYKIPRTLIKAVTGSDAIELFHSKNEAECCGSGSVMYLTHPDLSLKIAQKRIENALEEKIKIIITACPNCKNILKKACQLINTDIKVLDIVELITRYVYL